MLQADLTQVRRGNSTTVFYYSEQANVSSTFDLLATCNDHKSGLITDIW